MPGQTISAAQIIRVPMRPGDAGVDQTVEEMAKASMGQYGAGSGRIRQLALRIIRDAGVAERDQEGEITAIHEWVMKHLRYVRDPLWYEFVTFPETLAFDQADGDCDDHCVLEAALLGSIGIPTRFQTYGFNGDPIQSHVAMQALLKRRPGDGDGGSPMVPGAGLSAAADSSGWVNLDPIVKTQPAGWGVPDATSGRRYGVNTPVGTAKRVPNVGAFAGLAAVLGGLVLMSPTLRGHLFAGVRHLLKHSR